MGDSGLCCCVCVTSLERWLAPLFVISWSLLFFLFLVPDPAVWDLQRVLQQPPGCLRGTARHVPRQTVPPLLWGECQPEAARFSGSPWYNHTGWLGVKHQLTYLLGSMGQLVLRLTGTCVLVICGCVGWMAGWMGWWMVDGVMDGAVNGRWGHGWGGEW